MINCWHLVKYLLRFLINYSEYMVNKKIIKISDFICEKVLEIGVNNAFSYRRRQCT